MILTTETTDYDEYTDAQIGWEVVYRPVCKANFQGRAVSGFIGDFQVDFERWRNPLEITGCSASEGLAITLTANGRSSYLSEGLEMSADSLDLFGPSAEVAGLLSAQTTLITFTMPYSVLTERSSSPQAIRLAEYALNHQVVRSDLQSVNGLRQWFFQLLKLAGEGSMPAEAADRLVDNTLLAIDGALCPCERFYNTRSARRFTLARRARDYMLQNMLKPPSIAEICDFLSVSERTFYEIFSRSFGVSPKHFLKSRRLFAVRQVLKESTKEDRVSDIAMRYGFWDMGYFARDYHEMFGELPSVTLRNE